MKYGTADGSFLAADEEAGIRELVSDFYRIMHADERYSRLSDMHKSDIQLSIDKLSVFLVGWLGGPKLFREKYYPISIPQAHQHLKVSNTEMEQWLGCMADAIALQGYSESFAEYLNTQLRVPAARIVAVGGG